MQKKRRKRDLLDTFFKLIGILSLVPVKHLCLHWGNKEGYLATVCSLIHKETT